MTEKKQADNRSSIFVF